MLSNLKTEDHLVVGGGIVALGFAVWEVVVGELWVLAGVAVGLVAVLGGLAKRMRRPR